MHGDGAGHGLRARELQGPSTSTLRTKICSPFVDMEDDVDFARIGGIGLLGHGHSPDRSRGSVGGDDRVVVSGQVAAAKASGPA
jgi:hypothetical protein